MTSTHQPPSDGITLEPPHGVLTLYVSGASALSARAIANATALCELHLNGAYRLTVVDLHEDPTTASSRQVIAAPTLVRTLPLPERQVVGDLSHTEKVLQILALPPDTRPPGE